MFETTFNTIDGERCVVQLVRRFPNGEFYGIFRLAENHGVPYWQPVGDILNFKSPQASMGFRTQLRTAVRQLMQQVTPSA